MHGSLPIAASVAANPSPASGSECAPEGKNGGDFENTPGCGSDWFFDAAITICGKKDPGFQLHLYTGWPLTSCRYFVAHDPEHRRKPSPGFLRALFHSRYGGPFHRAYMSGCTAPWYVDTISAEQRALSAEAKLREISDIAKR